MGITQKLIPLFRTDASHVGDAVCAVCVKVGFYLTLIVDFILNRTCHYEVSARPHGYLNRLLRPLVRMDPAKEKKIIVRLCIEVEFVKIYAVMDRGNIVQFR